MDTDISNDMPFQNNIVPNPELIRPADALDDIPDIDELVADFADDIVTISILKGIGGHSTRLEKCDEVRCLESPKRRRRA